MRHEPRREISTIIKGYYLYGSHAKYYSRPYIANTQIILSPKASGTTMVLAEAGIRFGIFNGHKNKPHRNGFVR